MDVLTAPCLVLLSSPLLGPAVWAPVADRLRSRGHVVRVPRLPSVVRTPEDVIDGWLAEIPSDRDLVLVPHSNAGLYVAALADARPVRGLVFVDAGVPSTSATTPTAPPAFRAFLASLADHQGRLPPWTQWWDPSDVVALLPDPARRATVEQDQRRLPLSYFDAEVPSPQGWEALPAAYLAFGDTYAEERASAQRRHWPVRTMPGEHLHLMVEPEAVTDAILGLAATIRGCESFPVD